MASVKGSSVRTRRDFVLQRLGEAGWERILQRLPPALREAWRLNVLASAWYSIEDLARLEEAIALELALPAEAVCTEIGKFSAERSQATYRQYFAYSGKDPLGFFQQLLTLYPLIYDFGRVWLQAPTDTSLEIRHDFEGHATRTNCLIARSFFERSAALVGFEELRVREVTCQAGGAAQCVLSVTWGRGTGRPVTPETTAA